ncbi:MAG: ATP-binding protein [Thiovulaceae bacterium]|jgi:predicted AAA+ superfamily ATPase|nr:ATP-binding protein [Sulfurimonadaceae bacterium]MDD3816777.1 ATP-binding protein [Sulfurimonadaceae bacterium]
MEILLEELYKHDLLIEKYHQRKVFLEEPIFKTAPQKGKTVASAKSYQIIGITQSGKTKLIKHYLLSLKKSSYLYIDCNDIRLDIQALNISLEPFCNRHAIEILVLDNYDPSIRLFPIAQLIITSEISYPIDFLEPIFLYPLDYEEFLAYEHKYDSSALNHFFKLGGLPCMHKISQDERNITIQKLLRYALESTEFDILCFCAKMTAQKLSAFTVYERLKNNRKISKDKLYKSFESLLQKRYIHQLEKLGHAKATKKIYLCDIFFKSALTVEKHFGRLFENMIYLELLKSATQCYYDEHIDFYVPERSEIILSMPFSNERNLFKKIEQIEAFIFSYQVKKITAVTMNMEAKISHPFSKVEMVPFDVWALGD